MLVMLITVFTIQPFSTTAMTANNNQPSSTVNSAQQTTTKPQSLQTLSKVDATSSTSNLRNLSISDLLTYLKASFTTESGYFVDSSYDYLDTTVTAAKALNTLKMLGLTGYVIPLDNKTQIYNNFGNPKTNGGFAIKSGVADASIMGTYGAIETIQLLSLVVQYIQVKNQATNYLLSNYYLDQGKGGFKESWQTNLSVQSTYYAVQALNSLHYKFNQTQITAISSFLESLWNSNGYFSNSNDVDQSTILTSFQAISILSVLNASQPINSTFWNQIKTKFPNYVSSNQDQSGVYAGSIYSAGTQANVDDTGSALSALYILNNFNQVNVTSAIQFILQSQYLSGKFGKDVGGFSANNSTQSSTTQYSDVTLSHTYYAVLGLYASGYLTNNTAFSFQTEYSTTNKVNNNTNEMVVGQNTTLYAQVNTLNYKNAFDSYNIHMQAVNLSVAYISTSNNDSATGSVYNFAVTNTSTSSYTLGPHSLQVQFSLTNFTVLPIRVLNYTNDIVVRLPITSLINTVSTTVVVSPGTTLNGEIHLDTPLINQDGITYKKLGNVSVSIVYPDNTVYVINGPNDYPLSNATQSYYYTYIIPNNARLGDYFVRLNYYNGTSSLFYTQQVFTVSTNIQFQNLRGLNNKLDIYPGSNFNLNFTLAYENTVNMNQSITSINAKFIETTTQTEEFNVSLVFVKSNIFEVNRTQKVPVGLFVGDYNVSITLTWNSTTTGNQLVKQATNTTMPLVSYVGTPVIEKQNISPASSRTGNILYSGDIVNITANLGIKNTLTSKVYPLNNTYSYTANLVNTKDFSQVYQTLQTKALNNSEQISAFGEINSNINLESDVNISILLKVQLTSTGAYTFLSTNNNNITKLYIPTVLLKKAQLSLDSSTVDFIVGSSTVNLNSYTTLLATFKVKDQNSKLYVSGLNLNGTLVLPKNGNENATEIALPLITSLQENNSYQLQIPLEGLAIGNYQVKISTLQHNIPLGNFSLTINPESTNTGIPIENFISLGAVSIAVIFTIVAREINKRKK